MGDKGGHAIPRETREAMTSAAFFRRRCLLRRVGIEVWAGTPGMAWGAWAPGGDALCPSEASTTRRARPCLWGNDDKAACTTCTTARMGRACARESIESNVFADLAGQPKREKVQVRKPDGPAHVEHS
jgi:hypothetical protein